MKLLQKLSALLRAGIRFLVGCLLSIGVTTHGKRLIFVVTLFAGLNRSTDTTTAALHVLNSRMQVADDEAALQWPVRVANRIWGDLTLNCVLGGECTGGRQCQSLCQEELARMSAAVLDLMPKWMRYAPEEAMLQDARSVMQTNRSLQAV